MPDRSRFLLRVPTSTGDTECDFKGNASRGPPQENGLWTKAAEVARDRNAWSRLIGVMGPRKQLFAVLRNRCT